MTTTFRAAYWTRNGYDVRLTSEEHSAMSDELMMATARMEAMALGLDTTDGEIVIGDYTIKAGEAA